VPGSAVRRHARPFAVVLLHRVVVIRGPLTDSRVQTRRARPRAARSRLAR
jgi:hypothetical protein